MLPSEHPDAESSASGPFRPDRRRRSAFRRANGGTSSVNPGFQRLQAPERKG